MNRILTACSGIEETEAAFAWATSKWQLAWTLDQWWFAAAWACSQMESSACPSPPPPTPDPRERARTLCETGRPEKLYAIAKGVQALSAGDHTDGYYLLVVDFKDLNGTVGPVPVLRRHSPPYSGLGRDDLPDAGVIICVALRAIELETWCDPCHQVYASDAILWAVDPADGDLVGSPWLRHPADVDAGEHTDIILFGDGGHGLRPPEEEDIAADIETFLGI